MKTISCWQDLLSYGIDVLTGEACSLSMRLLCDVTAKGREVIRHCLSTPELSLSAPWNSGSKEEPHVGSVLLPPEMFVPIGVFALLDNDCIEVWRHKNGALTGIEAKDDPDQVEQGRHFAGDSIARVYRYALAIAKSTR